MELVKNLDLENYNAVAAMGGDGTNFQVLNGLIKNQNDIRIPIALIPAGSGNSFSRDLNFKNIEDGIEAITRNKPKPIDVLSFSQDSELFYFVNMTGFGFISDVSDRATKYKILGEFSYVIGVFLCTIGLKSHDMELEIDGQLIKGPNTFVEFCNSKMTAGSMMMAPDAEIDDGLMDIVVAGSMSRFNLLKTFPKIFSGKHGSNPAIKFYRAKKATVKTSPAKIMLPDGELFGTTPAEFIVHPKLVKYFF